MTSPQHQFGPLERPGVVLGLRSGTVAALLVGMGIAVLAVNLIPGWRGMLAALVSLLVATAVGFVPLAGRGLDEWLPVAVRWTRLSLSRRRRHVSTVPLLGQTAEHDPIMQPAPTLRGLRLLAAEHPRGVGTVGVVADTRERTYTVAVAVRGSAFALQSEAEKEQRLAGWAAVLSGLAVADNPLWRVQWLERTAPADADALVRYLHDRKASEVQPEALGSYAELIDDERPVTQQHEALVVVQLAARRATRAIRKAGGGDRGACVVLLDALDGVVDLLHEAGVTVEGALSPRLYARALRVGFDPSTRAATARLAAADPDRAGLPVHEAMPHATETGWRAYRVDGSWHTTYWIGEWPRIPVTGDFLAPLLLGTATVRTVSLVMEPVDPHRSVREVEAAITRDASNRNLREQRGFVTTARRQRQEAAVALREQELAVGHAEYRFAGYLTVSAATVEELERACGEIERRANRSRLVLRRLSGEQDIAFTASLPLGRGLRLSVADALRKGW